MRCMSDCICCYMSSPDDSLSRVSGAACRFVQMRVVAFCVGELARIAYLDGRAPLMYAAVFKALAQIGLGSPGVCLNSSYLGFQKKLFCTITTHIFTP